jgi:hypothetical protein
MADRTTEAVSFTTSVKQLAAMVARGNVKLLFVSQCVVAHGPFSGSGIMLPQKCGGIKESEQGT